MNQIFIRGNEIATKEYVDSLSIGGNGGSSACVIEQISASNGQTVINYDKDIRNNLQEGEIKYFYLNNNLIVSDTENQVIFYAGEIIKVSTCVSGGDATTIDIISSHERMCELAFVIFGDGTRSYSVINHEFVTKKYVDDAIAAIINGDEVAY